MIFHFELLLKIYGKKKVTRNEPPFFKALRASLWVENAVYSSNYATSG